jgi:hypothetical protein
MSFLENRVYVKDYSSLPAGSNLLIPVPTAPGHKQQYIHKAVFADFMSLSDTLNHDLGFPMLVASGWRPPLWATIEAYNADMIKQYGSVAEGRKWRAFASAHQTGLAFDVGCGGITPDRTLIPAQKKTKLYAWLVDNAYRWGWHPYSGEPTWHFEHKVSQTAFQTGVADTATPGNVTPAPTSTPEINDVCEDNTCMESPLLSSVLQP